MKLAVEAGRLAYRAGRIPMRRYASASSPVEGAGHCRAGAPALMADTAEPLEAVLRRLKKERDEADARYNEALTALDRALRLPQQRFPPPPPGIDDHQIAALNEAWNILPAAPHASGLKGRLAGFIWRRRGVRTCSAS